MHPPTHTHLLFCLDAGASGIAPSTITGILGSNITLKFTFVDTIIDRKSHFAVYIEGEKKIAERNDRIGNTVFDVLTNDSVLYHITNLKQNDSQIYWAAVFLDKTGIKLSSMVHLAIREENITSPGKLRLLDI